MFHILTVVVGGGMMIRGSMVPRRGVYTQYNFFFVYDIFITVLPVAFFSLTKINI